MTVISLVALRLYLSLDTLTDRTVVSGEFALWTGAIELYTTDTTQVIIGHIPPPGGHRVIRKNLDFHDCCALQTLQ